jgi:hypothetical protein
MIGLLVPGAMLPVLIVLTVLGGIALHGVVCRPGRAMIDCSSIPAGSVPCG